MFGQILLTLAVITIAYLVLRSRRAGSREAVLLERERRLPRISAGLAQGLAYGLVAVMVIGSGYYLAQRWVEARELVTVQVINANTGHITLYEARRGAVKGRGFVTLDGQRVTLADVERMILREPDSLSSNPPRLGH